MLFMEGHLQDTCECHELNLKYIFPVHVVDVCIVQMVLLKVDYTILLSMAPFEFGKYLFILFIWGALTLLLFLQSQPVEEFYRSRGKLLEFDLPGGIPQSWPKLLEALNLDDYEEKQSAAA